MHEPATSTHMRRASLVCALLAGLVTLQLAPAAAADLAPPTGAPKLARRTCARYGIAQTQAGPVARCLAHRTQTLRAHRTHGAPHAGVTRSAARGAGPPADRGQGNTAGASRHARAGSGHAAQAGNTSDRASKGSSSAAVVLAILAGAVAGAALLALRLGALTRRRRGGPHAAAS